MKLPTQAYSSPRDERAGGVAHSLFFLAVLAFLFFGWRSCSSRRTGPTVTVQAKEGLDLKVLTTLAGEVKSAEEFETRLNGTNGYHNLDLNADGKLDYIKVTEYGTNEVTGFSLTVPLDNSEEQEVATVEMQQEADHVDVYSRGHRHLYGDHYGYRRRYGVTDFLLWNWMNRPHSRYQSPHGYGHYPSQFDAGRSTRPPTDYRTTVSSLAGNSGATQVDSKNTPPRTPSPNAAKVSSKTRLSMPVASRSKSSGGLSSLFRSSSSSSSRSVRSFSNSRSGGFGGGGK